MIAEEINVIFRCFRGENTPKLYLLHFTKNVSSCYFTAVAIIKDHSDCIYMLFPVVLEKGAYFRSADNITHIILLTHVETVLYRSLETGTKKTIGYQAIIYVNFRCRLPSSNPTVDVRFHFR